MTFRGASRLLAACLALSLLLSAPPARAGDLEISGWDLLAGLFVVAGVPILEFAIPDFRAEWGTERPVAATPSYPLAFTLYKSPVGEWVIDNESTVRPSYLVNGVLELQQVGDSDARRYLGSLRGHWFPFARTAPGRWLAPAAFGPMVEIGGVGGEHGDGGFAGAGITWVPPSDIFYYPTLSAVYRYTLTSEETRHDAALDLQIVWFF